MYIDQLDGGKDCFSKNHSTYILLDTALITVFDETVFNITMKTKLLTCLVLW